MVTRNGTRLLIATGEAAASADELPRFVRALIDTASEVLVMTPILISRLQWLASDTDRARYEADERLSAVLGHLETLAPEADGGRPDRRRHAVHGLLRRSPGVPAGSHPDRSAWQPITPAGRNGGCSTRSGSSGFRSPSSSSTGRVGRRSGRRRPGVAAHVESRRPPTSSTASCAASTGRAESLFAVRQASRLQTAGREPAARRGDESRQGGTRRDGGWPCRRAPAGTRPSKPWRRPSNSRQRRGRS